MAKATGFDYFIILFTVVGALNVAINGLIGVNLISAALALFKNAIVNQVVYGIIGISAIIVIFKYLK